MADLVLGPVLRHVGSEEATVWVETDGPCEVDVLGCRARTFTVRGHHYALVVVSGLVPGVARPYEVSLDGVVRWPVPAAGRSPSGAAWPPSAIRPYGGAPLRVAVGSCRVAHPLEPPWTLSPDEDPRGHGPDALEALARRLRRGGVDDLPDLLLHIGDQVYADELPSHTAELVRSRRAGGTAPLDVVTDFEEYASLYREAWGQEPIRWLLSTVPSAMIFDDHELHDDWNTSAAWRDRTRRLPWWDGLVIAAFTSYWVYQHIGNLSPAQAARDPLLSTGGDLTEALEVMARRADEHPGEIRWSHARVIGGVRLVVVDSRASRLLDPPRRAMLAPAEAAWVTEHLRGDCEHLVVVSSLPVLLPPAIHELEAWNEALCAGAWGRLVAAAGERMRQRLDLEHWAAFGRSLRFLLEEVADVAAGRRGQAPSTVLLVGGDVHFGYLAQARFADPEVRSAVHQIVSSPMRNPLARRFRRPLRLLQTPAAVPPLRALARLAGVRRPQCHWRVDGGSRFDNQLTTMRFDGGHVDVTGERVIAEAGVSPRLQPVLRRRLL